MRPLPLRPLPMPGEPLSDFLERLANANGYPIYELWYLINGGANSHEKNLSDLLNGYALPIFSGPTESKVNIPVKLFGLESDDFNHYSRRWCPLCVETAAWLRPLWRLKVATICDIHGVRLLEHCPVCRGWTSAQIILCGKCECGIRFSQVAVPVAPPLVHLARALATSLTDNAILELQGVSIALTTRQIVRNILYTGRLLMEPQLSKQGQIRNLGDITVASDLFDGASTLLSDWPNTFWECLERHVAESPNDTSVKRVFGSLYHVIYQDLREPAFQFWRDAFESFLLDHWRGELCGRHRLFRQETIQANPNYGLAKIARITGIGRNTLKRMVQQNCLPASRSKGQSKRDFITIDKTQLSEFIPASADYLDLRGAARIWGIKHTRLRQLVTTEFIFAVMRPDWDRSTRWCFRRDEICGFLEEMRQAATSDANATVTVTLNYVLRYWRITATELTALLRAMRQREMPFTMNAEDNLNEVAFSKVRLHDWLETLRRSTTDWVWIPTAAILLGLKQQVVYQLVDKNLLIANLDVKNRFHQISLSSVERFRQEYVSLVELAKQKNMASIALLKQLDARPVTGPKVDGGRQYFYRRDDLVLKN